MSAVQDPTNTTVRRTDEPETSRWPRVIGTLGIIVGALMFVDKLDDLLFLPLMRSEDWWRRLLGAEMASLVVKWIPATAWIVAVSVIEMALGALLFVGGLRVFRARRSGAKLCRTWSWLALVWLVVEMSWALWWLSLHLAEIQGLAPGDWQDMAILGTLLVFTVLAAFPGFLLIWFSRPGIKAQLAGWPA